MDEPETCNLYKEGHISVLKDYGVTNVTSNNNDWMVNPNIYVVVAESVIDGELLGGIRVQISDENTMLPIEKAIGKLDPRIHDIVRMYRQRGVSELTALWNAKKIAGKGVSTLLSRAGISILNQLTCETMIGICAEYTLEMFRRVGFVVDNSLGLNGEFPYPNENYITRVLGILNASTLATAHEYDKMRMESLRDFPKQTYIEKETDVEIEIHYNLILANTQ